MGKPSASARLFVFATAVVLLGMAVPGGYMWHVNRQAIRLTAGEPTPISVADLGSTPKPAYLTLTDAVPGEPVLIRNPNPPTTAAEKKKQLPPTMSVWVPLYPKGADPKKDPPAAWHESIKVPDADKYTPPAEFTGLHADFAFGVFQPAPPPQVRAKFPATAAPVLLARHEQVWVICQIPGLVAAVLSLGGLACLACLPWASWDWPKPLPKGRKTAAVRLTRPVRALPMGSAADVVCDQGGSVLRGGNWMLLLGGPVIFVISAVYTHARWTSDLLGESGFAAVGGMLLGGGCFAIGVWQAWRRADRIEVHPAGLRWVRGNEARSCHWEDVVEVYRQDLTVSYNGVFSTRTAQAWVMLCDGTKMTFDHSVPQYEELVATVYARTFDHLLAVKRRELEGGRAEFGPFDLTGEGVEHDSGTTQWWTDLVGYKVENGDFWFRTDGMNLLARTVPCWHIPNLPVLLTLLDERFEQPPAFLTGRPWRTAPR